MKLERTQRSWKEPSEVRKFLLKLESLAELGKFRTSNFNRFFPTSLGSFQLRSALSNFSVTFQLQTFQLKTFQLPFPTTRIPTVINKRAQATGWKPTLLLQLWIRSSHSFLSEQCWPLPKNPFHRVCAGNRAQVSHMV